MRRLVLAAAVFSLCGGAALAQSISPNQSSDNAAQRGVGVRMPQTGGTFNAPGSDPLDRPSILPDFMRRNDPRVPARAPASPDDAAPAYWTGDTASWERHIAACAARYPTYDAATDTYLAAANRRERCTIEAPGPLSAPQPSR